MPINLAADTCDGKPQFKGAPVIAKAVMDARNNLTLSENVDIKVAAQVVPFGETDLNLTLARVENCTKGGPLDICGICELVWSLIMSLCVFIYKTSTVTDDCGI